MNPISKIITKNRAFPLNLHIFSRIPEDDEEDVDGDGEMRDGVEKIDHGHGEM